jgi:hypothetical protein
MYRLDGFSRFMLTPEAIVRQEINELLMQPVTLSTSSIKAGGTHRVRR